MTKADESVMCADWQGFGRAYTFFPATEKEVWERLLTPDNITSQLRSIIDAPLGGNTPVLEQDPRLRYKQVIPYTVITGPPAYNNQTSVLCAVRLPKGNEPRLHGNVAIGLGGHVPYHEGQDAQEAFVYSLANDICRSLP